MAGETADQELGERAAAGDTEAMVRLAIARAGAGDLGASRQWLERAAEAGSVDALFVRGVIEESAGERQAAYAWWLRAAEAGNGDAMFNLSVSAKEAGDAENAAAWLQRAAETGNGAALHNLGVQAQEAGDLAGAESCFERAADTGRPGSMAALAELLERRDLPAQAAEWYAKALADGDRDAEVEFRYAVCLGRIGDEEQGRVHLLRAAAAKHPQATVTLGDLARAAGDRAEAEYWYVTAADLGAAAGLLGLSLVRAEEGDYAAAEKTLRQAAEAGDPRAATLLAELGSTRPTRSAGTPTSPEPGSPAS